MHLIRYSLFSFISSFLIVLLIKILSKKNKAIITDHLHKGPQKLHKNSTPRIGGVGIFAGIFVFVILSFLYKKPFFKELFLLFLCCLPAFLTGLTEDLRSNLKPKIRLFLTSISGILLFFLFGGITKVDLPIFDYLLKFPFISFVFTVFAITGLIQAFNIIDGFNGLSSFISIMNLYALSIIAYKIGDLTLNGYCIVFIFSVIGFLLWNFPFGAIFLGDGGAYLIGYLIAAISILFLKKHPEISPWCLLLINIYPVYETIFSIYRRKTKKRSSFFADSFHLHTLIHKIINLKFPKYANTTLLNSFTSISLWFLNLFAVLPGIIFWSRTSFLIFFCFIFILIYTLLYKNLLFYYKNLLIRRNINTHNQHK